MQKLDGPGDYQTKWSKSGKEGQKSYEIAYMWNIKNDYKWTYLQKRNRVTNGENTLMAIKV